MSVTPMMAQWHACKTQAKDALVFFRLGDFYEAFYQDAEIIAKELSLTLTKRQEIPMCGVPFHTVDGYIDKLIAKGFKIAVAEQTEDPKAVKGIVKREIVRIITPGTIISSSLIDDKTNNFFVSLVEAKGQYGLATLDITTGEFHIKILEKESLVIDELTRLKPKEMLVSKSFPFLKELSFYFPFLINEKEPLDPSLSYDVLTAHFALNSLEPFGLRGKTVAITAAGSLILYLKEELSLSLEHIQSIQSDHTSSFMLIDRSTMANLEINSSFIKMLDRSVTPMGARKLRMWAQYPLFDKEAILQRQESVSFYIEDAEKRGRVLEELKSVRDIERLMMKVSSRYAGPRDILSLGVSLQSIEPLQNILPQIPFLDVKKIADEIVSSLNSTLPVRISDGDVFQDGWSDELDQLRKLSKDSVSWMAQYQVRLREESGIKTLKVGYTKAFGYYIEVSRAQGNRVPEHFQRRQTLVNAERFITEELKHFESQILSAEERIKGLESQLFEEIREKIANLAPTILANAKIIAEIDALIALANVACDYNWTKPLIEESDHLEIIEGRHPVIEEAIGRSLFIPNNTYLNQNRQMMLITGPNMAGKSTYIRQVALIVILAQIGSFVPAKSARIGLVDKVFSRIGASDDLAKGQSTFMVEMAETAHILHNVSSRSLVLLDEIGRGTSTYDGISIAWAVAEYLLTTGKKQAKTLFATHYWELTRLSQKFSHAKNFQTAVQEGGSGIVFLRKIVEGGTDKSYGIHVAKLAGLPSKAIQRAEEMLKELEEQNQEQLSLFAPPEKEHPALLELKKIDVNTITPLMAHQLLAKIQTLCPSTQDL